MADSLVKFERNKKLLGGNGALGIEATAPKDPALAFVLANNKPFPAGQLDLTNVKLSGEAGKDVTFGKGKDQASFQGDGGAFAGVGVYPDGGTVLTKLGLDSTFAKDIVLPSNASQRFYMLRWGYSLGAKASGPIALVAGFAPTFGASGKRERIFAVVRQLPKNKKSVDALQALADSWVLPKQVNELSDLLPGSWVIAEVDGSLGLSLGAKYGFDFNWIKEAKLGGLDGEIGLRVQLGVPVALGYNASGTFALMLSRESAAKKIRARVFKLSKKGWNFALNADAAVKPKTTGFLPGTFEEFVASVFGLNPAKLFDDLETLRKWTKPDTDLAGLLAGAGENYVKNLVHQVTGINPQNDFDGAMKRVTDLLDRWNDLPHDVATRLWKLVPERAKLKEIRVVAAKIQGLDADDEEQRKAFLCGLLGNVDFANTPVGEWLESAVLSQGDNLLKTLVSGPAFRRLQKVADQTAALLDGSEIEKALTSLHGWISERLNLGKIEEVVNNASFADMDAWLKGRLSDFLDEKLSLAKVRQIQKTIHVILQKKDVFWSKALDALNRQYQFKLAATYQNTTVRSAMLDLTFDFSKNGDDLGKWLRKAVDGQFDELMTQQIAGVTLHVAALSHGVQRQSHVSLDVPFFKLDVTHLNKALVNVRAVDEEGGRLLIYDPQFEDQVTVKNKLNSRLTIGGNLQVPTNHVRVRTTGGLDYSYSLRQATKNMRRQTLDYQLKPYVETYFPTHFPVGEGAFESWIGDLDKTIDQLDPNGTDNFGNTLLSLDVSLSQEVAASWLKAPAKKSDPIYGNMSRRLQSELKRTLRFYYFQNPKKFKDLVSAGVLLTWASIPPSTNASLRNRRLTLNRKGDIFWDWPDVQLRRGMVNNPKTVAALGAEMERAHRRLQGEVGMKHQLQFYDPSKTINAERIINETLKNPGLAFLKSLLFVEAQVVRTACTAAYDMAKFQKKKNTNPSEAAAALADFGSKLTAAFSRKLSTTFDGGALRPLGTQLFIAAAQELNPDLKGFQRAASLDLRVLKQDVTPFPPSGFPSFEPPLKDNTLVVQRLVSA